MLEPKSKIRRKKCAAFICSRSNFRQVTDYWRRTPIPIRFGEVRPVTKDGEPSNSFRFQDACVSDLKPIPKTNIWGTNLDSLFPGHAVNNETHRPTMYRFEIARLNVRGCKSTDFRRCKSQVKHNQTRFVCEILYGLACVSLKTTL